MLLPGTRARTAPAGGRAAAFNRYTVAKRFGARQEKQKMTTFRRCSRKLVPAILAVFCDTLRAQSGDAESPYFEPLPVVLTASRLAQPLRETPGSMTVLDEDLIQATGYQSIPRLLRLVPGMQVGQERGHNHWVTYHGLGIDYPNQMQVLIDGRSVISTGGFGGADWSALPLAIEDIERIEVVRGPNSAAYGSNAFLGVVNILTRDARDERAGTVSLRGGPDGQGGITARKGFRDGPVGVHVTLQRRRDEGFSGIDDDFAVSVGRLRTDLRLDNRNELTLEAGGSHGERGLGTAGTRFNFDGTRTAHHRNGFLDLQWHHEAGPDAEYSLSYSHAVEHFRDAWQGALALPGGGPVIPIPATNDSDTESDDLHFQQSLKAAETVRMVWGAEHTRTSIWAPFLFHAKKRHGQQERRLYGNLEWHATPDWVLNTGFMTERVGNHDSETTPRLALNWLASPGQTWRTGFSSAHRYPSLVERLADIQIRGNGQLLQQHRIPNPALAPQRVDAFELGWLGQMPDGRGVLDVRLFRERVTDLIRIRELTPDPATATDPLAAARAVLGSGRWENQRAPVLLTGLEYQLRVRPASGTELVFNHTLIDADSRERQVARTVAPWTASLTWLQRFGAWQGSLGVIHSEAVDMGLSFVPGYTGVVPAYTTVDASLAWAGHIGRQPLTVRLSGINLTGRHSEVAYRVVQQDGNRIAPKRVEPQIQLGVELAL